RRLRASDLESQISAKPNASATRRAAWGTPGGSAESTSRVRSAISGVRAEATLTAPTRAAAHASNRSAGGSVGGRTGLSVAPFRDGRGGSVAERARRCEPAAARRFTDPLHPRDERLTERLEDRRTPTERGPPA